MIKLRAAGLNESTWSGIVPTMSSIAQELDQQMSLLDPTTARRVEQLVRDALALAKTAKSGAWPAGYFEQTAGALAGEQFERPEQGTLCLNRDEPTDRCR